MWIKICGMTDPVIARQVADCGPDAIGLNFYSKSPRCVSIETARTIVNELPPGVEPVGLFVNHDRTELREICEAVGLRTIQLHGDETPEFIAELSGLDIIRAFRVGGEGLASVAAQLEEYDRRGISLKKCLVDARVEGAYGGTGHTAPWEILRTWNELNWPPLVLAGGLTPDNVQKAIQTVRPAGVDVASGVEECPGKQSVEMARRFIRLARST